MIEKLRVRGLLSFGWAGTEIDLRPLNLLIGPNGSGKSNLLDVLDLLRAVPGDFQPMLGRKGGAATWLHKARDGAPVDEAATIELTLRLLAPEPSIRYRIELAPHAADQLAVVGEELLVLPVAEGELPYLLFSADRDSLKLSVQGGQERHSRFGAYHWETFSKRPTESALGMYRHLPLARPLATELEQLHLIQSWQFGPDAAPRRGAVAADQLAQTLLPNGTNLAVVLHRIREDGAVRTRLRDALRRLYRDIDDVITEAVADKVRFALQERGQGEPFPPSRLSDGTLRWLGLLCVLLDPTPPPILCIKEPELGLHPDLLNTLAELLRDASERSQLIVTTHSDRLLSAFGDTPEDVVVCDRDGGTTSLRRLEKEPLDAWLKDYQLGEVWMRGQLGGTRW